MNIRYGSSSKDTVTTGVEYLEVEPFIRHELHNLDLRSVQ